MWTFSNAFFNTPCNDGKECNLRSKTPTQTALCAANENQLFWPQIFTKYLTRQELKRKAGTGPLKQQTNPRGPEGSLANTLSGCWEMLRRFLQDSSQVGFHRGWPSRASDRKCDRKRSDPHFEWTPTPFYERLRPTNHPQWMPLNETQIRFSSNQPSFGPGPTPPALFDDAPLLKMSDTLSFSLRGSCRHIFSLKDLRCCHVPGCLKRAPLDTLSRSRCGPHASNPDCCSAYYIPKQRTLNWNHISLQSGVTLKEIFVADSIEQCCCDHMQRLRDLMTWKGDFPSY